MEQLSMLYAFQTAVQTESPQPGKSEDSGFSKLMEQTKHSTDTTRDTSKTKTEKPEQTKESEPSEKPAQPEKKKETDETALQELAAMQSLYLDAAGVTIVQAEEEQPVIQINALPSEQGTVEGQIIQTAPESAVPVPVQTAPAQTTTEQSPMEQTANPETAAQSQTVENTAVQQDAQTGQRQEQQNTTDNRPASTVETKLDDTPEGTEAHTVFGNVETAPIKVSETTNAQPTEQPKPVSTQVEQAVEQAIQQGESHVELQLNPEHLGKVTVELTRQEDGTILVALHAENSQTRGLLERDASGLQQLLSRGTQQTVQVEVPRQEEAQQQQDLKDGHQKQNQHHRQQQQHQDSGDFLDRLRLGLVTPEEDAL